MLGPLRDVTAVSRPRVVGPITLAHGANEFFSIAVPPIIPFLVSDFGISYAEAGLLLTAFFVMYSVFQLPAGVLADWVGKKRLLVAGLVVMSGGVLLASAARSYELLLVAQAVAGVGGSTFHPTGMALISDVETGDTEGKAMGVFGFGGAVGTIASPVLVGGLAAVAGWRTALGGAAVLGVAVTLAFVSLFADPEGRSNRHTGPRSDGGRSRPIRSRVRPLRELVNVPLTRGVVLLLFATLFLSLTTRAINTFTTAYVAGEAGGSVAIGNVGFFVLLSGGSLSSLWAGGLADRFDRGSLGGLAAVGTAVLVGATAFVDRLSGSLQPVPPFAILAVWFFLIGAVVYACVPVKNAIVSEQSEREFSGSLFGVIQTASAVGSAVGPVLFGALATEWGVAAAYPTIAVSAVVLAGLFALLSRVG